MLANFRNIFIPSVDKLHVQNTTLDKITCFPEEFFKNDIKRIGTVPYILSRSNLRFWQIGPDPIGFEFATLPCTNTIDIYGIGLSIGNPSTVQVGSGTY